MSQRSVSESASAYRRDHAPPAPRQRGNYCSRDRAIPRTARHISTASFYHALRVPAVVAKAAWELGHANWPEASPRSPPSTAQHSQLRTTCATIGSPLAGSGFRPPPRQVRELLRFGAESHTGPAGGGRGVLAFLRDTESTQQPTPRDPFFARRHTP